MSGKSTFILINTHSMINQDKWHLKKLQKDLPEVISFNSN